jgi:hypothetical protein
MPWVFYDYAINALGVSPENIKMLIDAEADQVEIYKAFRNWLPSYVKKDKTDVYVFYSGHGCPRQTASRCFSCPRKPTKTLIDNTGIPQRARSPNALEGRQAPQRDHVHRQLLQRARPAAGETLLAWRRKPGGAARWTAYGVSGKLHRSSAPRSTATRFQAQARELQHGIFQLAA